MPVVPPLPTQLGAKDWFYKVLEAVVVASNNSDVAGVQTWFLATQDATDPTSLDLAGCPVAFRKLDMKLAAALKEAVAKG